MQVKKIAFLVGSLGGGGAERVASILVNNLCQRGIQILFIAAFSEKKDYDLNGKIKYKFIDVNSKNKIIKFIKRTVLIDKEIHNFSPDVIISFLTKELIFTNIKKKYPIIYSLRNDPNHMFSSKLERKICIMSFRNAKNIVFQSSGARDYFETKIRKKGVIIGNPIKSDLPLWKGNLQDKKLITACRLTAQKNLKMLIRGFSIFKQKNEGYSLEIYGDGEQLQELIRYVEELNMSKFIHFKGRSNEIYNIMADSSVFLLTSDYEGVSNSMLEALAIGIPTICTDCPPGGAKMYIDDGKNGFLVNVGDFEELAKKLDILVNDKEKCEMFSKNSREIREILSEENIVNEWMKLL